MATINIDQFIFLRPPTPSARLKGLTHSVPEHSAENMIFVRIWGGRPGIETENASNRSSLMIEIYVTPF